MVSTRPSVSSVAGTEGRMRGSQPSASALRSISRGFCPVSMTMWVNLGASFAACTSSATVKATPLPQQHLTLALETGFQASEKPITEAIADSVLSKQIDGVEATLNRYSYTTKVLTEMLGVKAGELRGLFRNELSAERTRDLKEQMLSAGLPV